MSSKRTTASRASSSRFTAKTLNKGEVSVEQVSVTSASVTETVAAAVGKEAAVGKKVAAPASKRLRTKPNYNEDQEDEDDEEDEEDEEYGRASSKKKRVVSPDTTTITSITSTTTEVTSKVSATSKKPAAAKKGEVKTPIRADAHVNTTMPNPLALPKTPEGCIKITSWNVSGLNASLKKGFKTYLNAEDADVICLQEHKVNQPLMNLVDPKVYPFSWWGFEKDKKGYAGVAMFSKTTPISFTAGLPTHPDPSCTKGRIVTLEYPTTYVIGCYVPNAGQGLVRLKERMVWDVAMKAWLLELKTKGKHIIWTGDLNVCHKPIDLRNPSTNTLSAGFTKEERAGFSAILDEVALVDTFREIKGEGEDTSGYYSYFSYRFQCRIKGIGWRLDYFVTDKELLKERVVESVIREECYGASDHVPVVLVLKGVL